MKNKLTILGFTALLALPASGALINIIDLDPDDAASSGFTITTSTTGMTTTLSFTQTGDLDGQGTANDTLSFDLIYEAYSGSTVDAATGDVALGTQITPNLANVNFVINNFQNGNTLSLEVANVVYTDGEGDEAITFQGFTAINVTDFGNPDTTGTPDGPLTTYVGTTGATAITFDPTVANVDLTSNGTDPALFFTIAPGDGPVRLRDADFFFETIPVPEPSSTALLGLGGLGLLLRRKRA